MTRMAAPNTKLVSDHPHGWPGAALTDTAVSRVVLQLIEPDDPVSEVHQWNRGMGELLAGLPSEVRVHILCLALGRPTSGALLRRWLELALVCRDWMQELVLHVPVSVRVAAPGVSPWLLHPTRQWLLQPVPRGLRIAELALRGGDSAAFPARAMPKDLFSMQASQLQNIQCLTLWNSQCPNFPPMPSLSELTMSFESVTGDAMLPLPRLTTLEKLSIQGADHCPSLSCLTRLTLLRLRGHSLSGNLVRQASADIHQGLKGLSQLRFLYLNWDSPEPVRIGETLMGLKQLVTLRLALPDFSGVEQLPPLVTDLILCASKHLDMAAMPCLQRCSSLQSLALVIDKGVQFQLGHCWPMLTKLILTGGDHKSGNFRLQHWPPLEAEPLCLPSLADLYIDVWSDASGLLQLEHTIVSLMLSTSGPWHPERNDLFFGPRSHRALSANTCNK